MVTVIYYLWSTFGYAAIGLFVGLSHALFTWWRSQNGQAAAQILVYYYLLVVGWSIAVAPLLCSYLPAATVYTVLGSCAIVSSQLPKWIPICLSGIYLLALFVGVGYRFLRLNFMNWKSPSRDQSDYDVPETIAAHSPISPWPLLPVKLGHNGNQALPRQTSNSKTGPSNNQNSSQMVPSAAANSSKAGVTTNSVAAGERHLLNPAANQSVTHSRASTNPSSAAEKDFQVEEFVLPSPDLLEQEYSSELAAKMNAGVDYSNQIEKTFLQFDMHVRVVHMDVGPVLTQYELELEPGLRAKKVIALADDLAIALKAPSVRIVAPIPGKNTIGIEVPNVQRLKVTLKEVLFGSAREIPHYKLPICLGKDIKGENVFIDLSTLPHLLIAGRTGTGKSVCLNSIIISLLMTRPPQFVRFLMIDPKVVELSLYQSIPHLLHPVVTDMKKAENLLAWAVEKMEERYTILARHKVRNIESYHQLNRTDAAFDDTEMPYIVIVVDEMADLMMTSAKEVEAYIIRLAQKSRAVGIHLVLATQKPTVDVITGLIKSNLPARIAFQVSSRSDSRVILDEMGAEKLLGNGDLLFSSPGASKIIRCQGTYVSDREVNRVVEYLSSHYTAEYVEELLNPAPVATLKFSVGHETDELYAEAVEIIIREGRGSVSLLQRALGIGYGRAARLIDMMADAGIVGQYNGSQAREVLYTWEEWDNQKQCTP